MSSETLPDHNSDQCITDVKSSKHQGIMQEKVDEYIKVNKERTPENFKETTPENFKETLVFTDGEIEELTKIPQNSGNVRSGIDKR